MVQWGGLEIQTGQQGRPTYWVTEGELFVVASWFGEGGTPIMVLAWGRGRYSCPVLFENYIVKIHI